MIDAYSHDSTRKEKRDRDEDGGRDQNHIHKSRNRGDIQAVPPCNHCNKSHPPCNLLNNHPDCNLYASTPFAESERGKAWLTKGYNSVSTQHTLDVSLWHNPNANRIQNGHNHYNHRGGRRY